MRISDAIVCILISTLAVSYGWGMRGSLIGGEKGAMLPGALIGLILGWFSGTGFIGAAAAGLMGMTFGGTETYGETIGMVLHRGRDDYNPVRGYSGLAFKGALWFAVCGAFLGISLSYGVYETSGIFVFCLLIPVMQIVGELIFNRPLNPEKNKYPLIYFSKTRREEWGGNLLMLIALVIMAIIKKDYFTLILIAGGLVFGAIGWLVGMKAFVTTVFPLKNGKYLFGRFYHKGIIDGWKIMEFVLGAFGGFGLSLAYCFGYGYIETYQDRMSLDGPKFIDDESLRDWIPIIYIACVIAIVVINLISFIYDKKGKAVNSYILDHIERPFYNVIPMMFVLAGSAGEFVTVFMLVFVVVNKLIFDRFKTVNFISVVLGVSVCVASYFMFAGDRAEPITIVLAGTVPYIAGEVICVLSKKCRHGVPLKDVLTKSAFTTVFPAFVIMSVILIVSFVKIFAV